MKVLMKGPPSEWLFEWWHEDPYVEVYDMRDGVSGVVDADTPCDYLPGVADQLSRAKMRTGRVSSGGRVEHLAIQETFKYDMFERKWLKKTLNAARDVICCGDQREESSREYEHAANAVDSAKTFDVEGSATESPPLATPETAS
ncbi:hypothetical protein EV421DRAFT_1741421 [Armillaria borealis]|uniref:Uncharacterized protein n=1 Tax=Armillaria borealis TaxID=47425 RepID=A0AA39IZX8_9AGAR|nr:hypothetical protein EV421DRAFT_1741421 [Armillaria borealis]